MSAPAGNLRALAVAAAALLVAACASPPPPPEWQANARQAVDAAVAAHLEGNARVAEHEAARARAEIARSGRLDLLARAELMLCAARVASLSFEPCEAFENLRADAGPAELAYADFLAGRLRPQDLHLLPAHQQALAGTTTGTGQAAAALAAIDDPLSRLIAAGVLFTQGRASPQTLQVAVDTASAQGWRRPLLAWLKVQLMRAEQAGAEDEVQRLRRRAAVVGGP
jgi:hypothetical protein